MRIGLGENLGSAVEGGGHLLASLSVSFLSPV